MIRVKFNKKIILKIDHAGIVYQEDNRDPCFINFNECRDRWVDYVNTSKDFTSNDLSREETKCVGWRDAFAHPAYIEFFTEPRIRFEFFETKNLLTFLRLRDTEPDYTTFLFQIWKSGWSLYDLG